MVLNQVMYINQYRARYLKFFNFIFKNNYIFVVGFSIKFKKLGVELLSKENYFEYSNSFKIYYEIRSKFSMIT